MPTCRLCGLDKPFLDKDKFNKSYICEKSHIIPKQLYKPIRQVGGNGSPIMYTVGTTQELKQFQNGIYDSGILCNKCDGDVIGPWDNYGQSLLRTSPQAENYLLDNTGKSAVYKVDKFDYKKLKLFFMSILWRAEITNHKFFEQVSLGSWEQKLRDMIYLQDPGTKHDFSVILFKYEGNFNEIMPNPSKQRQDGINFYRFRIPGYAFLIKVDQREFCSKLHPFIISPNQPLLVRITEYTNSKEYEQILDLKDQIPD